MEQVSKTGWIEIICGPMFAGKSEELIRRIKRLEYAKKDTLVFKPYHILNIILNQLTLNILVMYINI